jgi:hypothetical protein
MAPESPSRVLHSLAGSPEMPGFGAVQGPPPCRICGLPVVRGQKFAAWLPPTATDWSCWQGPPEAVYICEPCAWVRSGKPSTAVPWTPGAALTTSLRLYSHVWDDVHGWRWATLSGKRFIRDEFLRSLALPRGTPFLGVFSDGGLTAKQSLAYARINHTGQTAAEVVLDIERVAIQLTRSGTWPMLELVQEAYQAGWSKAEIEAGQANANRIKALGVALCDGLARRLRRFVGNPELALAVWMAQREEETSGAVEPDDAGVDPQHLGGSPDRLREELPRESHENVDPAPGHDVQQRPPDGQPRPLVHPDPPSPPDREPGERGVGQLSLFDLGQQAPVVPRARR